MNIELDLEMPERNIIDRFEGEYAFLSNFFSSMVEFDGTVYSTVEHAYQAAKTLDKEERTKIGFAYTANEAKKLGRKVTLRKDWEEIKIDVMLDLLRQKFSIKMLADQLLATGDAKLVEGNWWGDTFWGVCKGVGENHLGKLLMQVRQELQNE